MISGRVKAVDIKSLVGCLDDRLLRSLVINLTDIVSNSAVVDNIRQNSAQLREPSFNEGLGARQIKKVLEVASTLRQLVT